MSFFGNFESKKEGIDDTVEWILRVTVVTLAAIMMAVIMTLMFGLFNNDVDNTEIFAIIGPAFNTIVGAFVGLLGGLSLNANARDKKTEEPEAPLELTPEMEVGEFNSVPLIRPVEPEPVVEDDDEDDDMAPWEKHRHDLRWDVNGDGVVDEADFPDWRNPAA
jgi:hypothetical protein